MSFRAVFSRCMMSMPGSAIEVSSAKVFAMKRPVTAILSISAGVFSSITGVSLGGVQGSTAFTGPVSILVIGNAEVAAAPGSVVKETVAAGTHCHSVRPTGQPTFRPKPSRSRVSANIAPFTSCDSSEPLIDARRRASSGRGPLGGMAVNQAAAPTLRKDACVLISRCVGCGA